MFRYVCMCVNCLCMLDVWWLADIYFYPLFRVLFGSYVFALTMCVCVCACECSAPSRRRRNGITRSSRSSCTPLYFPTTILASACSALYLSTVCVCVVRTCESNAFLSLCVCYWCRYCMQHPFEDLGADFEEFTERAQTNIVLSCSS